MGYFLTKNLIHSATRIGGGQGIKCSCAVKHAIAYVIPVSYNTELRMDKETVEDSSSPGLIFYLL